MAAVEPLRDLHLLPKTRDSWSFLYLEHARIDQDGLAVCARDAAGTVSIPCATLSVLLLGPGTSITHAAIRNLADAGCLVVWSGEEGVRFYAQGMGETRSSRRLLRQAALVSNPSARPAVVRRMYEIQFPGPLGPGLSLQQIRGMEGIRVRDAYARLSRESGVAWSGRAYRRSRWSAADLPNRALSVANSALYGIAHAAIVSAGYSPSLGFIHTGMMRSFVYDVADLYKVEVTIPAAFWAVADGPADLERRVRTLCRDYFHASRLLERIIPDIERVLDVPMEGAETASADEDEGDMPGGLWDPGRGVVAAGVNYGGPSEDGSP